MLRSLTPPNDGLLVPESIRAVGTLANLSDLKLYTSAAQTVAIRQAAFAFSSMISAGNFSEADHRRSRGANKRYRLVRLPDAEHPNLQRRR